MTRSQIARWLNRPFLRDYGMAFVLLLLAALFSGLTLKEQYPSGAEAGEQVAAQVLARYGKGANVLIIARNTAVDRAFAAAASKHVRTAGAHVLATVHGGPSDARRAIEQVLTEGGAIDAVIANEVTQRWTIYDRIPGGREKLVVPRPYVWPDFLKRTNLIGVANQTSIYAMIAIGMTLVIITGGIDLSVGSLVALASVTAGLLIREWGGTSASTVAVAAGALAGVGVCAAAGALNGLLVTAGQIPPFIATLGMMMMASGLAFRLTGGSSIPELPESLFWLGRGRTLGLPNPILLMAILYVLAHVVMSRMVFGRHVYAIGGNPAAARLSGIAVRRTLLAVYTLGGALAGLGGVVLTSQLSAADPKFGLMYELDVIAAVVVGGASLMGGQGKIFGTLIGAFIIAVIKNGMNLTSVDPFNQKIVLGAVLTGAVVLDTLKRRTIGT